MTTIKALIQAKQRRDTAADVADRIKRRRAAEQAYDETIARFPLLTTENAAEALAFQERRLRELTQA